MSSSFPKYLDDVISDAVIIQCKRTGDTSPETVRMYTEFAVLITDSIFKSIRQQHNIAKQLQNN